MSDLFLIVSAVVPAVILMVYIYKKDTLEKEPTKLLGTLVLFGVVSTVPAVIIEAVGSAVVGSIFYTDGFGYALIMNFIIISGAEEGAKFFFLKRKSWRSPDFNCQFDGVVYAVFVSLGFALLENVFYVLQYGFTTAIARALLSVPGHACFGVFMGAFYGMAKRCENSGYPQSCKNFLRRSVIVPILLHGVYDFIATTDYLSAGVFFVFVGSIFTAGIKLTDKLSKEDQYIDAQHWYTI